MTPREELAARLDSARRRKNLSIRAVARLVDVPAATVQGWLSGKHAPTPALQNSDQMLHNASCQTSLATSPAHCPATRSWSADRYDDGGDHSASR